MTIPKLERLMNLTAALLDTVVPLSAEQIRNRVAGYGDDGSAFKRQFERDKDDLREMGVPVRLEAVPATDPPLDGYRIPPDEYYLPDPGLEPDELAAVRLALRAVRIEDFVSAPAMWKLGDSAGPDGADLDGADHDDSGDGVGPRTVIPSDPNLAQLFAAASGRTSVTFDYRGVARHLEPSALSFQRGHWYVSGFDTDQDEVRRYRLDRVVGECRLGGPATAARAESAFAADSLEPWRIGEGGPITARVRLDATIAPTVVHEVGRSRVVERYADGSVDIELDVTNPDGFRSWVLGFVDRAEVLGPPELREQIIAWLQHVAVGGN